MFLSATAALLAHAQGRGDRRSSGGCRPPRSVGSRRRDRRVEQDVADVIQRDRQIRAIADLAADDERLAVEATTVADRRCAAGQWPGCSAPGRPAFRGRSAGETRASLYIASRGHVPMSRGRCPCGQRAREAALVAGLSRSSPSSSNSAIASRSRPAEHRGALEQLARATSSRAPCACPLATAVEAASMRRNPRPFRRPPPQRGRRGVDRSPGRRGPQRFDVASPSFGAPTPPSRWRTAGVLDVVGEEAEHDS